MLDEDDAMETKAKSNAQSVVCFNILLKDHLLCLTLKDQKLEDASPLK